MSTATIRFRHPLDWVAVYQKATFAERVAVHRAIAGVLAERAEPDGAAWQRLAREFGVWTCGGQRKAGMFGTLSMRA